MICCLTARQLLEKELGQRLSVKQVAEYLGVDARLVKEQYLRLGGVRLGSRRYIFFERRLIDALSEPKTEQEQISMGGSDQDPGKEKNQVLYVKKGRSGLGGRAKKEKADIERHNDIFG